MIVTHFVIRLLITKVALHESPDVEVIDIIVQTALSIVYNGQEFANSTPLNK